MSIIASISRKNSVSTSQMKDFLKNPFPLYIRFANSFKNLKISGHIEKVSVH